MADQHLPLSGGSPDPDLEKKYRKSGQRRKVLSMILSVVVAIVVWQYVLNVENPTLQRTFSDVPIEMINSDSLKDNGLAIRSGGDQKVSVTVSGKRNALMELDSEDLMATVDLTDCTSGDNYLDVSVYVPSSISIKRIHSAQVKVGVERIVTEEIDVQVSFSGSVSSGFQAVCLSQSEETIRATAARSVIKQIDHIAAKINVRDLSDDPEKIKVTLVPVDSDGYRVNGVELSNTEETLTAQLYQISEVSLSVSTEGGLPEGLTLKSMNAPELIKIAAPKDKIESLTELETEPVNLSDLTESTTKELTVVLPEYAILADGQETPTVSLTITEDKEETTETEE